MTFDPEETTKTIDVINTPDAKLLEIRADCLFEYNESITLKLANIGNGQLIDDQSSTVVTIISDDRK